MAKFFVKGYPECPVLIDDEDEERVSKYDWYCTNNGYIYNSKFRLLLARFIMNLNNPKVQTDHINRNTFDNRKENLRVANQTTNKMNKGPLKKDKYKGVYFHKENCIWRARITVYSKDINLGCFKTPEEAARVYDKAAKLHFGEFAYFNFPEEIS